MTHTVNLSIKRINDVTFAHLSKAISSLLPSRGMVMINLKLQNGRPTLPLEPDGYGSHILLLTDDYIQQLHIDDHQKATLSFEIANQWTSPPLADDILAALHQQQIKSMWEHLTIKAQWEWVRWIRFTNNPTTRLKRIKTMLSMLEAGKKRPCCFDHSRCTLMKISSNGKLKIGEIVE